MDFARCPRFRGQDRSFDRLGQRQIVLNASKGRFELAVDSTKTMKRADLARSRVAKLRLPPGATYFGARQVWQLAYRTQRMTSLDRSYERMRRLYRKLGVGYEYFEQPVPRPKGMHRTTYERMTAELCEALELHDCLFTIAAADAGRRKL